MSEPQVTVNRDSADAVRSLALVLAVAAILVFTIVLQRHGEAGTVAVGQAGDISLEVGVDRPEVASGQKVIVTATVTNNSGSAVDYLLQTCGSPVAVDFVPEPPSMKSTESWQGVVAQFRQFAVANGKGPGGVPVPGLTPTAARPESCGEEGGIASIDAHSTLKTALVWSAELAPGVEAPSGRVRVEAELDLIDGGSATDEVAAGDNPTPIRPIPLTSLTAEGDLQVTDGSSKTISASQALDAVLANAKFDEWLSTRPVDTWSGVNIYMTGPDTTPGDSRPPAWTVEVFREAEGAPRDFSIARVNPTNGTVSLDVCAVPCDR